MKKVISLVALASIGLGLAAATQASHPLPVKANGLMERALAGRAGPRPARAFWEADGIREGPPAGPS